MSVETLLKLRDALRMGADALNEELEKHATPYVKATEWEPSEIQWVKAEGMRGPYQKYPGTNQKEESTSNYRNLIQDLVNHKEKLTKDGYFYWLFSDGTTVGRKKRKK